MPNIPRTLAGLLLATAVATLATAAPPKSPLAPASPAQEPTDMQPIIHAPELPKDASWLNTDKPLQFSGALKGQVVLLDFWTYCCINCLHVLPDLDYLEQKYKDQPVVILGVHSAKFDNEADAANIRSAIQRYEIHHPVLVDINRAVWSSFDVHSWPTVILVGSDGRIIGGISGEGHRALLEKVIDDALAEGKKNNTLAAAPLKLTREGQVRAATGLSFPGKILALPPAGPTDPGRLVIIDSNHNRIVITSYPTAEGRATVQQIIGSGKTGAADGGFATASFNRPQGATISGSILWIADTENHLVRRIDLDKKNVTTALGSGKQVFDREAGKSGKEQGLNSPWDVAVSGNRLFIAQAGQHQIFAMNLMTGMTEIAAGSSRENIRDGDALAANLAQPSGLAIDAKNQILYFADSEVSAIRALNLKTQQVSTLVGHGLFDFGDIDGDPTQARLQHPLGVTLSADGKTILVADTYNHRIKQIDIATNITTTLAGSGKPGTGTTKPNAAGNAPEFFEPAGLALGAPGELFVADTNNHRIVRLTNLTDKSPGQWKELTIDGLTAPGAAISAIDPDARDAGKFSLAPATAITLKLNLKIPALEHLTPGAPLSVKITDGTRTLTTESLMTEGKLPIETRLAAELLAGKPAQLYVSVYYTHCSAGTNAVCTPGKSAWKFALDYSGTAKAIELK